VTKRDLLSHRPQKKEDRSVEKKGEFSLFKSPVEEEKDQITVRSSKKNGGEEIVALKGSRGKDGSKEVSRLLKKKKKGNPTGDKKMVTRIYENGRKGGEKKGGKSLPNFLGGKNEG